MRKRVRWSVAALSAIFLLIASVVVWREMRQTFLDASLISAIKKRQTRQAIALLDQGANANAVDTPTEPQNARTLIAKLYDLLRGHRQEVQAGNTALMLVCGSAIVPEGWIDRRAAESADEALVLALLEHGANPNMQDNMHPTTVLEAQCIAGKPEVVRILLEHGADPNLGTEWLPLDFAARNNHREIVKLLLRYGAKIDAKNSDGKSVLWCVIVRPDEEIAYDEMIDLLLSHNADINARGSDGDTLLHVATFNGPKIVKCLLDHGANPLLSNHAGKTPLYYATHTLPSFYNSDVVRLLTEAQNKAKAKRRGRGPDR